LAYCVALESADPAALRQAGVLAAHLVADSAAEALAGAELVASRGWVGLRSHPRPAGSISLGTAGEPDWLDAALRQIVDGAR
jgi:hypothetical protein